MKIKEDGILLKLGQKVRYERVKTGVSQEKLAELAELNTNSIGMLERGELNINIKNLEKIALALNLEIVSLFDFRL